MSSSNHKPRIQKPSHALTVMAKIKPVWWTKYEQQIKEHWTRFIEFTEKYDKAVVALSTLGIFLFTFALFVATYLLYTAGEQQSERQLRAYISVRADYVYAFGPNIPVEVRFPLFNHGQTPAYKVSQAAAVDILPFPLPKRFRLPENTVPAAGSFVLHPQASFAGHVFAKRMFSAAEIGQVTTNSGARIYIYGAVKYKDAFKRKRGTMFCFSIVGDNNLAAVSGGAPIPAAEIKFQPSEEFNQAT
jgi:hypothetical protein